MIHSFVQFFAAQSHILPREPKPTINDPPSPIAQHASVSPAVSGRSGTLGYSESLSSQPEIFCGPSTGRLTTEVGSSGPSDNRVLLVWAVISSTSFSTMSGGNVGGLRGSRCERLSMVITSDCGRVKRASGSCPSDWKTKSLWVRYCSSCSGNE